MGTPDELTRHLSRARAKKLPMTVREILYTHDESNLVAVMVDFADGTSGGCLIPIDMLSMDNIKVSAVVVATVWEMLNIPAVWKNRRGKSDEVINLDG